MGKWKAPGHLARLDPQDASQRHLEEPGPPIEGVPTPLGGVTCLSPITAKLEQVQCGLLLIAPAPTTCQVLTVPTASMATTTSAPHSGRSPGNQPSLHNRKSWDVPGPGPKGLHRTFSLSLHIPCLLPEERGLSRPTGHPRESGFAEMAQHSPTPSPSSTSTLSALSTYSMLPFSLLLPPGHRHIPPCPRPKAREVGVVQPEVLHRGTQAELFKQQQKQLTTCSPSPPHVPGIPNLHQGSKALPVGTHWCTMVPATPAATRVSQMHLEASPWPVPPSLQPLLHLE